MTDTTIAVRSDPEGVKWDDVIDVRMEAGRAAAIGFSGEVVARSTGADDARDFARAWKTETIARLASGGSLSGTSLPGAGAQLTVIASGLALMVGGTAAMLARAAALGRTTDAYELPSAMRFPLAVQMALLGAVALLGLPLLVFAWHEWRNLRHWRKWELSIDGLTHYPYGKRKVLRPLAGDFVTPNVARINERRVPLRWLTAEGIVAPVLLAMGERAKSGALRMPLGTAFFLLLVNAYVAAQIGVLYAVGGDLALRMAPLAAAVLALTWGYYYVAGRRLRAALAEGREMLAKLGW